MGALWRQTEYGGGWHLSSGNRAACNRRWRLDGPALTTEQAASQPGTGLCGRCRRKAGN